MKKIITIAGNGGSGKSTIAKLLEEKLGYKCVVMGDIMRRLASENNMDIVTFNEYIKEHPEFDHQVDDMIVDISEKEDELIIVSRTAWHFAKESFRVYLYVEPEVAGKRIFADSQRINEKKYDTLEEAIENTRKRNESEKNRYMSLYNIDVTNLDNYDLALDTSALTIDEVLDRVLEGYNKYLER